MSQHEIDIILSQMSTQINQLREDMLRANKETRDSMEKGFLQHSKLFSDWGAVVKTGEGELATLKIWQEGHRHETTALADALNTLAQTQQKTAEDVAVVKKYQDKQKTIIAFVATLVSVVWVVVTFVLDKLLK